MANSGIKTILKTNTISLKFYFHPEPSGLSSVTNRKAFKKAIKKNDVRSVLELIHSGVDADIPVDPVWKHTPLILATCYGAQGVLPVLLRVCLQKDACNYEGHTALDKAIIYFSLASQFFQNKPVEIERRYMILRSLIEGGCKKVKIPDVELWVKENKRDSKFISSLVDTLCLGKSVELKSIVLAMLIRLDTKAECIKQILESGANFSYYVKTCSLNMSVFPGSVSDSVAELLIKSTNNQYIYHHIVAIKSQEARKTGKGAALLKESLTELLSQVDYPLEEYYLNLFTKTYNAYNRYENKIKDLKHLCRSAIRGCLIHNVLFGVKYLPLPTRIKSYIMLEANLS